LCNCAKDEEKEENENEEIKSIFEGSFLGNGWYNLFKI